MSEIFISLKGGGNRCHAATVAWKQVFVLMVTLHNLCDVLTFATELETGVCFKPCSKYVENDVDNANISECTSTLSPAKPLLAFRGSSYHLDIFLVHLCELLDAFWLVATTFYFQRPLLHVSVFDSLSLQSAPSSFLTGIIHGQ